MQRPPIFHLNETAQEFSRQHALNRVLQTVIALLKAGFEAGLHHRGGEDVEIWLPNIRQHFASPFQAIGLDGALHELIARGFLLENRRSFTDGNGEHRVSVTYAFGSELRDALLRAVAAADIEAVKQHGRFFAAPGGMASFAI